MRKDEVVFFKVWTGTLKMLVWKEGIGRWIFGRGVKTTGYKEYEDAIKEAERYIEEMVAEVKKETREKEGMEIVKREDGVISVVYGKENIQAERLRNGYIIYDGVKIIEIVDKEEAIEERCINIMVKKLIENKIGKFEKGNLEYIKNSEKGIDWRKIA